jgi:hypothetical protein
MNRILRFCVLTACCVATVVAAAEPFQKTSMGGARANRSEATIEGLVRDIACPMQNLDGDATHLSLKCVRDCVKAGSPIGVLTRDGELYLPISDKMPDYTQRQKLMPFLGKYVQVKGIAFERNGTHAIVITDITEMKGVQLTLQGG